MPSKAPETSLPNALNLVRPGPGAHAAMYPAQLFPVNKRSDKVPSLRAILGYRLDHFRPVAVPFQRRDTVELEPAIPTRAQRVSGFVRADITADPWLDLIRRQDNRYAVMQMGDLR